MRKIGIVTFLAMGWIGLGVHTAYAAGGVSNSLINVPSAFTLDAGSLEFSPTWQSQFRRSVGSNAVESLHVNNNIELRATFGLPSYWEVGFVVAANWTIKEGHSFGMDVFAVGIRKDLVRKGETWALNVQAGLLVPFSEEERSVIADLALAQTYRPWSWMQIDVSVGGQIQNTQQLQGGARYDIGVGAFVVREKLQIVVEWSHAWAIQNETTSEGLLGVGINWYVTSAATITVAGLAAFAPISATPEGVVFLSYTHLFELPKPKPIAAKAATLSSNRMNPLQPVWSQQR
ncbi:MAG: hypothetical protein EP343_27260 [Deltaproteobacteria bacterium]|nr:MAG: hypothetical protein EP343_27260 [Deltaproteobacteria bacterium]